MRRVESTYLELECQRLRLWEPHRTDLLYDLLYDVTDVYSIIKKSDIPVAIDGLAVKLFG